MPPAGHEKKRKRAWKNGDQKGVFSGHYSNYPVNLKREESEEYIERIKDG